MSSRTDQQSTPEASPPAASGAASPASPQAAGLHAPSHREILTIIGGLMIGMFLSSLDQTVVGTAIRTIGDDLHGLNQQAWVTTAYLITSTIATPIYGKLSDIFGRRPLYIFGLTVFILGSFLSSFSTSMIMLAAFRAFQGIGAGALMSVPLAIMGDMLAPRERAKYQGFFLAVFGVSAVVGPLIGGVFADASQILWIAGWRWVFLINVPVGVGAMFMVLAFLHLPKFHKTTAPRIDWWGASAVVVTLVPLLLVAEQGREWGWTSASAITCYVIGVVGLIAFFVAETIMKADAIIPLRLFRSSTFSMSTVLGFLVGFGMFGAMLTLPLYLQLVTGLTPTESGFATLPMVGGLMIASVGSGQAIARTGKYRIFPITGTLVTAGGYLVLTFMTVDRPLWFLMMAMFFIGLGFGQLMQSLTLATQNAVDVTDMGVATSSATFFRQIGGTLGTAVLLSVLFALMPTKVSGAMQNTADLTSALDAALTPSVASAPANQGVMNQIWNPIVTPVKAQVQTGLDQGTAAATQAADAAVTQQVTAAALAAAAQQAGVTVAGGKLTVDYTDAAQRGAVVGKVVPTMIDKLKSSSAPSTSSSSTADTSFLKGADKRLTRPFLAGFNDSAVVVYWVGLSVMLLAFVLTWFFKTPPLRQRSALQERADALHTADDLEVDAIDAAVGAGAPTGPGGGTVHTHRA